MALDTVVVVVVVIRRLDLLRPGRTRPGTAVLTPVGQLHVYLGVPLPGRITLVRVGWDGARLAAPRQIEVGHNNRLRLYWPCRWDLHCRAQAVGRVVHTECGPVDHCDVHGRAHREWAAHGGIEPWPVCSCRRGFPTPGCARHEVGAGRGTLVPARMLADVGW